MDEQFLDASAIDDLSEYELTGDSDDIDYGTESPEESQEQESTELSPENESTNQLEETDDLFSKADNKESLPIDDFTKEILRIKGISDPSKIKFQDESGAIVERPWDSLTTNEKLSIMTLEEDTDTDLEDEEIAFINMLRNNNLTPSKYLQLLQDDIVQRIQDSQPVSYEIDNLSDDELFALDLIEKLGEDNITDEELRTAIEQAKSNEDLYRKQVEALKTHYRSLENQRKYEEEVQQQEQLEQNYRNFSERILSLIEGFDEIAGQELELSVDDKNDIANYILTRDDTGQSDFYKDLQNPQALTTAAFWMIKGPEIMSELQTQIQEAYKRGYAVGSTAVRPEAKPATSKVVIAPKVNKATTTTNTNDANAAFGDDESYLYN